jgi:hypothetical protein
MTVSFDVRDHYWAVDGDTEGVFSSAVGKLIGATDPAYLAWLGTGEKCLTRVKTQDELVEVLRRYNVPPYHAVPKSLVLARLGDQKAAQAFAIATIGQQLRWNAPGKTFVNADDQETIAIIQAVGEDPAVVLAPENEAPNS